MTMPAWMCAMRNKNDNPNDYFGIPKNRPHLIAFDGFVGLPPQSWYANIRWEGTGRTDDTSEARTRYAKMTESGRKWVGGYPEVYIGRGKVQFMRGWSVKTSVYVHHRIGVDGNEVSDEEYWGSKKEIVNSYHEEVELPQEKWVTRANHDMPRPMYEALYGPLKILL